MSRMADGIGGRGIGTAATGDLSAQQEFETLEGIRDTVKELESDYNARHPDSNLSGRIIHVAHYIPFVVRSLAEVDFERRKEERIAAISDVAAMAAAARAKRALRQAAQQKAKEEAEQAKLQDEVAKASGGIGNGKKPERKSSLPSGRAPSFSDFEDRLAQNQARAKIRAGRKAWMMTPVVDEDSDSETDSLHDRFTPTGSRRQSAFSYYSSRGNSFSAYYGDGTENRKYSAVSDDNSPLSTPPEKKLELEALKPQWVLTPRRGHTALNSGIRSLCSTHNQTFIGWPGDLQFPTQAKNDDRTDPSQTNPEERKEIEEVMASLDESKNWAAQEAPVKGVAPDPLMNDGAPPVGKVPTPLMNGADPIGEKDGQKKKKNKGGKEEEDPTAEKGIKYVPVWLDNNVAHGHYEGYCKTSEYLRMRLLKTLNLIQSLTTCPPFLSSQLFGLCSTIFFGKMFLRIVEHGRTTLGTLTTLPTKLSLRRSLRNGDLVISFGSTTTISFWYL